MQFLLHKAACPKNSLIHLYQENVEADGIFKKKIDNKLRKMLRNIVSTNLFRFHHFLISCGDLSACKSFGHTVHTLVDFHRL